MVKYPPVVPDYQPPLSALLLQQPVPRLLGLLVPQIFEILFGQTIQSREQVLDLQEADCISYRALSNLLSSCFPHSLTSTSFVSGMM